MNKTRMLLSLSRLFVNLILKSSELALNNKLKFIYFTRRKQGNLKYRGRETGDISLKHFFFSEGPFFYFTFVLIKIFKSESYAKVKLVFREKKSLTTQFCNN